MVVGVTRYIRTRVVIDGEAEYKRTLGNINAELRNFKSALELVEQQNAGQANTYDALKRKLEALNDVYAAEETKLKTLSQRYSEIVAARKKQNEEVGKIAENLEDEKRKLDQLIATKGKESDAVKKATKEYETNKKAVDNLTIANEDYRRRLSALEKEQNGVRVEMDKLGRSIKETEGYLQEAAESSDGIAHSLDNMGRAAKDGSDKTMAAVSKVGKAFAAAAIAAVVKGIADELRRCSDVAIEWGSAFAGVVKTVDGTAEQLEGIAQGIRDMSMDIPAAASEIAAVAEQAGQLGIATDDILAFTRVMIDLGNSTNLSADEASTALAKFANIMRLQAEDYEHMGSAIVALGNNFATTEADIVAMSTRIASAGKSAGLSTQDILALSAALSSVGIEAEAGGSAISNIIKDIANAVSTYDEAAEVISRTGMSTRDLVLLADQDRKAFGEIATSMSLTSAELRDYIDKVDTLDQYATVANRTAADFKRAWGEDAVSALQEFVGGLQDTERLGSDALAVLDKMEITQIRQSNAVLALSASGGILNDTLAMSRGAWEDNTALMEEAAKRYETTASKQEIFKNQLTNLRTTIGEALLPAYEAVIARLGEWAVETEAVVARMIDSRTEGEKFRDSVGATSTKLQEVRDEFNRTSESIQQQQLEAEILRDKLLKLLEANDGTINSEVRIKDAVDRLNELLPDLGLTYDDLSGNVDYLTERIDANIAAMQRQAKAAAYMQKLTDLSAGQLELELKHREAQKEAALAQEKSHAALVRHLEAQKKLKEATEGVNWSQVRRETDVPKEYTEAHKIAVAAKREWEALNTSTEAYIAAQKEAAAELKNVNDEIDQIAQLYAEFADAAEETGRRLDAREKKDREQETSKPPEPAPTPEPARQTEADTKTADTIATVYKTDVADTIATAVAKTTDAMMDETAERAATKIADAADTAGDRTAVKTAAAVKEAAKEAEKEAAEQALTYEKARALWLEYAREKWATPPTEKQVATAITGALEQVTITVESVSTSTPGVQEELLKVMRTMSEQLTAADRERISEISARDQGPWAQAIAAARKSGDADGKTTDEIIAMYEEVHARNRAAARTYFDIFGTKIPGYGEMYGSVENYIKSVLEPAELEIERWKIFNAKIPNAMWEELGAAARDLTVKLGLAEGQISTWYDEFELTGNPILTWVETITDPELDKYFAGYRQKEYRLTTPDVSATVRYGKEDWDKWYGERYRLLLDMDNRYYMGDVHERLYRAAEEGGYSLGDIDDLKEVGGIVGKELAREFLGQSLEHVLETYSLDGGVYKQGYQEAINEWLVTYYRNAAGSTLLDASGAARNIGQLYEMYQYLDGNQIKSGFRLVADAVGDLDDNLTAVIEHLPKSFRLDDPLNRQDAIYDLEGIIGEGSIVGEDILQSITPTVYMTEETLKMLDELNRRLEATGKADEYADTIATVIAGAQERYDSFGTGGDNTAFNTNLLATFGRLAAEVGYVDSRLPDISNARGETITVNQSFAETPLTPYEAAKAAKAGIEEALYG